eukprot:IDg8367t1
MNAENIECRAYVYCMRQERIGLVRPFRTREQDYVAKKSTILRGLKAATVVEVPSAVVYVRATQSGDRTRLSKTKACGVSLGAMVISA